MIKKESKNNLRKKRQKRVRKSLLGTEERPRLVVYRSNRHIYAQVIDDLAGKTIASANSLQKDMKSKINDEMSSGDVAKLVGSVVAEKAVAAGLKTVVFDRAGYKYHGQVAALADGARESGLKF